MIMRLKKFHFLYMTTILLFLFLAFSKIVYAKNYKELTCKNLTIENGLQESTVESIIQDHNGYIWIATGAGLQRYDGENFKIYKSNSEVESAKSLSSNYITIILEDRDNELDRKSTRLNSSHANISYAVFCLKKKNKFHLALALKTLHRMTLIYQLYVPSSHEPFYPPNYIAPSPSCRSRAVTLLSPASSDLLI